MKDGWFESENNEASEFHWARNNNASLLQRIINTSAEYSITIQ